MFPRQGAHNRVTDYRLDKCPAGELSIHTWMDADLRELADLVKQTHTAARHRDAHMEFALVFPDKRGVNVMRVVCILPSPHVFRMQVQFKDL
jgi:histone deacetylase complex subunit SAP18